MARGGFALTTEHSSQFCHPRFPLEQLDFRMRASCPNDFIDDKVRRAVGCDLRQVRNADDLAFATDLLHFFTDSMRRFTTNVRVHFIENKHGNLVDRCENSFEGKHDAREFARGGNMPKGFGWFAWIGGEKELDCIESAE